MNRKRPRDQVDADYEARMWAGRRLTRGAESSVGVTVIVATFGSSSGSSWR